MDTHQVAIYVHTYPRDEAAERRATEARITRCLQFAGEQGFSVVEAHIYQDIASGLTFDLVGLENLRKAMQTHEFSVRIVNELTQLSRDMTVLGLSLTEAQEAGVNVVCVANPPAGYQWDADHTTLEVFPPQADIIHRLFEQYQA